MRELKQLTPDELARLYFETQSLRTRVLGFVQEYGFDANSLVSQTFEREIEKEYGRKTLKQLGKKNNGSTDD